MTAQISPTTNAAQDVGQYSVDSIYNGDNVNLTAMLPDACIDLIFTDPVYDAIEQYAWLSREAARVLKPDSACLAWYGIGYLPDVHAALSTHLTYRWRLITRMVRNKEFHGRLCVMTQECAWYEKGRSKPRQSIFDYQYSKMKGNYSVGGANWGKALDSLTRYIETFCPPGGLVFDPFCGSGSIPAACKMTGRHYLGFELDPTAVERANERLAHTQRALPIVLDAQPQQWSFLDGAEALTWEVEEVGDEN